MIGWRFAFEPRDLTPSDADKKSGGGDWTKGVSRAELRATQVRADPVLMSKSTISAVTAPRLPFLDAMRAVVATLVTWHHFERYGPLWNLADPEPGLLAVWVQECRWAIQVFFIISGYVLALSMSRHTWNLSRAGSNVARRYVRLGLPYLVAIALAVAAAAAARGRLSENEIGAPPTLDQLLAHAAFLQDILGYPSLSAGLWFVAIEFQLGLIYLAIFLARDTLARFWNVDRDELSLALGWTLALASLFYFNVDESLDVWGLYFFAQFFTGVVVYHALARKELRFHFYLYVAAVTAALLFSWRWRLAGSLLAGIVVFAAGRLNLLTRWPTSRMVDYLGRTSYSLFLVHYPVLIVVSTIWLRLDWTAPRAAAIGLVTAYLGSLALAELFYRAVEAPTAAWSRRFG
jgi:peptidoglycan/LPS O-acetylase OafA/YrhL